MAAPWLRSLRSSAKCEDARGFALAMVVFLLFAVAVASATGYQIVNTEWTLTAGNENTNEALAAATAGLNRLCRGAHRGARKRYVCGGLRERDGVTEEGGEAE